MIKKALSSFSNAAAKWQEDQKNMYRPVINTPAKTTQTTTKTQTVQQPKESKPAQSVPAAQPTQQDKQQAQQYARAALSGESGVYVSPSQVPNAYVNAYPAGIKTTQTKPQTTVVHTATAEQTQQAQQASTSDLFRLALAQQQETIKKQQEQQENLLKEQNSLKNKQRRAIMDSALAENNSRAEDSLRRAYVANMLYKRDLPQQLKNMGISGGTSESALMDRHNTYMNSRNEIEKSRLDANNKAKLIYQQGADSDYADYISRLYKLRGEVAEKLAAAADTAADYALKNTKTTPRATKSKTTVKTQPQYTATLEGTGLSFTGTKAQVQNQVKKRLADMGFSKSRIEEYMARNGM